MLDRVKNLAGAPEATAPLGKTKMRLIKIRPTRNSAAYRLLLKHWPGECAPQAGGYQLEVAHTPLFVV